MRKLMDYMLYRKCDSRSMRAGQLSSTGWSFFSFSCFSTISSHPSWIQMEKSYGLSLRIPDVSSPFLHCTMPLRLSTRKSAWFWHSF